MEDIDILIEKLFSRYKVLMEEAKTDQLEEEIEKSEIVK